MITVRFPNGQTVTYNDATCVKWFDKECALYRTREARDAGNWIVWIPSTAGAVIEFVNPCIVRIPNTLSPDEAMNLILREGRNFTYLQKRKLADVKKMLEGLNRQTLRWKK